MQHLIELSFGPVQDFIAAARRTADLWAGSSLLSDVARAAGNSLLDSGAQLIYPACDRVRDGGSADTSNLSNVMLACIEGDASVASAAVAKARAAAAEVVREAGRDALRQLPALDPDRVTGQLDDALESFAAWSELGEDYQQSYKALKVAFGARKNTRDFTAYPHGASVPKNSLDGLRETVLPARLDCRLRRRLQLSDGEQLDALGVVKRLRGRDAGDGFTPLTRIAAHGWLSSLTADARRQLQLAYEPLVALDLATRARSAVFEDFPFDAGLVYAERLERARREVVDDADDARIAAIDRLREVLRPLWRAFGSPNPYVALLMADGDQMGKCVGSARSAADHEAITRAVSGFADSAIKILAAHDGQAIYAGGEDVLGMIPMASALSAPSELAQAFKEAVDGLPGHIDRPTLRVGVVIAHMLEPLGTLRDWAQKAEAFAKGEAGSPTQGNALGLRLHVRAGHVVELRMPFSDDEDFQALGHWIAAYVAGDFPSRLGYDARGLELDRRLRHLPDGIARAGFTRLLERARESGGGAALAGHWQPMLEERLARLGGSLERLGTELIFARWVSARTRHDLLLTGGSR